VDVMLVLVIILLVTAPLLTQSVHVTLPKTVETTANINDQPLQLGINAQGVMTLNKNPIADLAALEIVLKAELEKIRMWACIYTPTKAWFMPSSQS